MIYSHLLTIVAPRSLAAHENPSSKQSKLFRSDPQSLVRHLSRRANEINNQLYEFVHLPMHAPGWENKIKHILEVTAAHREEREGIDQRANRAFAQPCCRCWASAPGLRVSFSSHLPIAACLFPRCCQLLRAHSRLQNQYLYPLMRSLYPSDEDRVAYGQAWTDYLLRAKTAPQPPSVKQKCTAQRSKAQAESTLAHEIFNGNKGGARDRDSPSRLTWISVIFFLLYFFVV